MSTPPRTHPRSQAGESVPLSKFSDKKALLVVNVASA